jgi:hypothetical protein
MNAVVMTTQEEQEPAPAHDPGQHPDYPHLPANFFSNGPSRCVTAGYKDPTPNPIWNQPWNARVNSALLQLDAAKEAITAVLDDEEFPTEIDSLDEWDRDLIAELQQRLQVIELQLRDNLFLVCGVRERTEDERHGRTAGFDSDGSTIIR